MLAENEKPIVAFIGRLDPQKGLELVRHAIFHSLERGAQFVLLGSSPDRRINADFWGLKFDLTKNLKNRMDAENITIPYPQRTVHSVAASAAQ